MSGMGFPTPDPQPFNWAQPYNPAASMGFDPSGFGGIAPMLLTPYLMQFAGPTNFLPHQNPAQAVTDQLAMRQYFNNTQANTFAMSRMGTGRMAATFGGLMSMATNQPLTDLNRQQAYGAAEIVNNPYLKPILAQAMGPENFEAAFFGTRGDPAMLGAAANRVGYYRRDPATGARRMSGQSLEDFSRGVYASLYEPSGNIEEMVAGTRAGDKDATAKLKKAANAEHETVVSDDDLTQRIADMGAEEVEKIYLKYNPSGKAKTVSERAREISQVERAVRETGVLSQNETHVTALQRRAEDAAVESAHGFMAGQTGEIMENLFQRGMLPQSIGALSAAERVKILAAQDPDKETMTRLARQFGHRELLENDEEYAAAVRSGNQAKQDEMLDARMPDYERRVSGSLTKIKERQAAGPVSAEDAENLLKMDGMDSMASNVDANRASGVIKQHTEALAAIRQIFGDNGNTNAPIPALLAALDHLSQGAASRSGSTGRVASTLREMRSMAKEMGMGFEQMAGMASAIGAYGDQLGLAGETKVEAQANTMAMINRMRNAGAFSNQGFGAMSEGEASQRVAALAVRSEASVAAKGSAAIRRLYATNKDKYENTELGAIAKLMEDPNWTGDYEWNGEKKNFYTEASQHGGQYFAQVAENSGTTASHMQTVMMDRQTQEYQTKADALKAADREMTQMVTQRSTRSFVEDAVQQNPRSRLNQNTEQAHAAREAVARTMTNAFIDSAGMSETEQLDHLEKTLEADIVRTLQSQGYSEAEAKAEAATLMNSTFGTDPKERRDRLQEMGSSINNAFTAASNGETRSAREWHQMRQGLDGLGDERAHQRRVADMEHRLGTFYGGTPMARGSDFIAKLGVSGRAFNFDEFLEATFGIKPNSELRNKIAPELVEAFTEAQQQITDSTVTDSYLRELTAGANDATGTKGARDYQGNLITGQRAKDELRSLAMRGMTDEQKEDFNKRFRKEVSAEELATKREAKLAGMTDEDVDKIYQEAFGESATGTATTTEAKRAQINAAIRSGEITTAAGLRSEDLLNADEGEYTQEQMLNMARQQSGGGARDEGFLAAHEARRKRGRARFTGLFARTDAEVKTGLRAALIDEANETGFDISAHMEEFMNSGLYAAGDEKARAEFEKMVRDPARRLTEEQQNAILKTFSDFRAARDLEVGAMLDPEQSGDRGVPVAEPVPAPGARKPPAAAKEAGEAPKPGSPVPPGGSTPPTGPAESGRVPTPAAEPKPGAPVPPDGSTAPPAGTGAGRPTAGASGAIPTPGAPVPPGGSTAPPAGPGESTPESKSDADHKPGEPATPIPGPPASEHKPGEPAKPDVLPTAEDAAGATDAGKDGAPHPGSAETAEDVKRGKSDADHKPGEPATPIPGPPASEHKPGEPDLHGDKGKPDTSAAGQKSASDRERPEQETQPQQKKKKVVGDQEIARRQKAKLAGMSAEELDTLYASTFGDVAEMTASRESKERRLLALTGLIPVAGLKPEEMVDAEAGELTREQAVDVAAAADAPPKSDGEAGSTPAANAQERKPGAPATPAAGTPVPDHKPGQPSVPDILPPSDNAEKKPTRVDDKGTEPAKDQVPQIPADQAGHEERKADAVGSAACCCCEEETDALVAEISKLTDAIKDLEKSFSSLVTPGRSQTKSDDMFEKDSDRSGRAQKSGYSRITQQTYAPAARHTGGGGGFSRAGGGSSPIKGTLTLVGLQSAILSARGSPVFTPTGDGPSIVPGNPAAGAYISSANVSPASE